MEEPESKRITLVDKKDLRLDLEYNESFAIIHLPHLKMTRETYVDMMNYAPDILEMFQTIGFSSLHTAIEPSNKITLKLMDRLGATKIGEADGYVVYEYKEAKEWHQQH